MKKVLLFLACISYSLSYASENLKHLSDHQLGKLINEDFAENHLDLEKDMEEVLRRIDNNKSHYAFEKNLNPFLLEKKPFKLLIKHLRRKYKPDPLKNAFKTVSITYKTLVPTCIAFSPDNRTLAIGFKDAKIALFDVITKDSLIKLFEKSMPIFSIQFSKDGKKLIGYSDNKKFIWNPTQNTVQTEPIDLDDTVINDALNCSDSELKTGITACRNKIKLWTIDKTTEKCVKIINTQSPVKYLTITPNGKKFAFLSKNNRLEVWQKCRLNSTTRILKASN